MDVVFWGAGQFLQDHKEEFEELRKYTNDKWLGIYDINPGKTGDKFLGMQICLPEKKENTLYVITSRYVDEIRTEIQSRYNVRGENIIYFEDYCRKIICREKYLRRYRNDMSGSSNCKKTKFSKSSMVVYTCITGEYDILQEPVNYNSNLDYLCFTNNKKLKSRIWEIRYIEDEKLDNMYLSRYVKLLPHKFVKEYDTSIWVDAKFLIQDDLLQYISKYEKTKDMLSFPHPERDCIYDEAKACKKLKRGIPEDIDRQIQHYKKQNYPSHNGLFENGCMVRNHNESIIQRIMTDWWEELVKFSYRDQLSLPYVFRKYNYIPDICDLDINNNRWLKMVRKI